MRFLIVRTVPLEYNHWLYSQYPGLGEKPFDEQLRAYAEDPFFIGDSYSYNLRRLGHEAMDVVANCEILQETWANENGVQVRRTHPFRTLTERFPRVLRAALRLPAFPGLLVASLIDPLNPTWLYDILAAQIRSFEPDVLINLALGELSPSFMARIKPHVGSLVGQFGWPLPEGNSFRCYDLFVSPLPNVVAQARQRGIRSELLPLGFDSRVLSRLNNGDRRFPVTFVGNVGRGYPWASDSFTETRIGLLEYLCDQFPLRIWGHEPLATDPNSPIRKAHMGPVWGAQTAQILRDSKVVVNVHGSHSGPFAANLRLYETTGVGSFLVTDNKPNLHEILEPDKEVVAYQNPRECARLIQYYLDHEEEREEIASAGQRRTLRDHTYDKRMLKLLALLENSH